MKPKILLLSGYDAASHRYWRQLLAEHLTEFDWTQIALPNRHFSWRVRGSSLSLGFLHNDVLNQDFDLIIATSMVDLSSLRGFVPKLASIPTIVYFHENQFVYPVSSTQPNIVNAQLTSIYSAICANKIVFNSHYNQQSFFDGAKKLFKRLPDGIPKNILIETKKLSTVIPVPLREFASGGVSENNQGLLKKKKLHIVWNHRWEYDKQPEVFFAAILKLKQQNYDFEVSVLGQSFRKVPEIFEQAKLQLSEHVNAWGFQPIESYRQVLSSADIVVSTASHDFQGLSLLEAIAYGCVPVAPDRIVYPEYLSAEYLYAPGGSLSEEIDHLFAHLCRLIEENNSKAPDISSYQTLNLIPQYRNVIEALINAGNC